MLMIFSETLFVPGHPTSTAITTLIFIILQGFRNLISFRRSHRSWEVYEIVHRDFVTAIKLLKSRGNGDLTNEGAKTHFTAWAFMKSPLLNLIVEFFFFFYKYTYPTKNCDFFFTHR